ncbi:hypothetical protein MMC25_005311 [Agyrium rufum]|nr:hypothetical protein [Agyrium rufum]
MVPFRADQLEIRHTKQITSETISAEEFPWADSHEGGDHAYLLPATRSQQSSQGGSVSSAFQKFRVEKNQWFRINMKGKLGKYCTALHKDPPDMSVCDPEEETELYGVIVHMTDNVYHIDKDHGTPYTLDRVFGPRKGTVKKGKRDITLEKDSTNTDNISLA